MRYTYTHGDLIVLRLPLGELETNCFLVCRGNRALVVDPGADPVALIASLREAELTPQAILLTHAHYDHLGAISALNDSYAAAGGLEVWLHPGEEEIYLKPEKNYSSFFAAPFQPPAPPRLLPAEQDGVPGQAGSAGAVVELGGFRFRVLHTPGHTKGSVCFVFDEGFVLTGDTLFESGIGRTDLYSGDQRAIERSIRRKLYTLPPEYTVYPGHGDLTSIGRERRSNPFVRPDEPCGAARS